MDDETLNLEAYDDILKLEDDEPCAAATAASESVGAESFPDMSFGTDRLKNIESIIKHLQSLRIGTVGGLEQEQVESMTIHMRTKSGKLITFENLKPTDSIDKIKARLFDKEGRRITYIGKHLETGRTLAEFNLQRGSTIEESSGGMGGGKLVKTKFVKKGDETRGYKLKMNHLLTNALGLLDMPTNTSVPAAFEAIASQAREEILEIRRMSELDEEEFNVAAFKHLREPELNELAELITQTGQRPEEKLMQIASMILPGLKTLHEVDTAVKKVQLDMHVAFMELYVEKFGIQQNGSLVLKHSSLHAMVVDEKKSRVAVRRHKVASGESASSEAVVADEVFVPSRRGCAIS